MCGRYDLSETPQRLKIHFGLQALPPDFENTDVRPTDEAPVVRIAEGRRLAVPCRWGLIPSWSKDEKIAQHTFNARAETVAEKPTFRMAFMRHRCVVPVSAFFEWQSVAGEAKKRKLRIASVDNHPLALAGLWDRWHNPQTKEARDTFTIITTAANQIMAPIHDRMPVILGECDWDAWLDPDMTNPQLLQSMLRPCPDNWLAIRPS